ncbi:acyl carrier protein [Verrucomicrobia bacterium]|nr:acyl carrier protein [Verrucomicrobiota bacterium]
MISDEVKSIVIKQLKVDASVLHEDLGAGDIPEWDSLGHVNLLMAVEEHFGVSFDVSDAVDIETLGDLVDTTSAYVRQKGGD